MGKFWGSKSRPATPTQLTKEQADDQARLAEIAARFDLSEPSCLLHFWYCATEEAATAAAASMRGRGWRITRLSRAVDGTGWGVVAAQDGVMLSSIVVNEARRFFATLAASLDGGEYDGWEHDAQESDALYEQRTA